MKKLLYIILLTILTFSSSKPYQIKTEQIQIETQIIRELSPDDYYMTICESGIYPNKKDYYLIVNDAISKNMDYVLVLALVLEESRFKKTAINYNNNGSSDYGYFQLNDEWHDQYKNDIQEHISYGIDYFKWCLKVEDGDVVAALSRYNSGSPRSKIGLKYAYRVLNWKDTIMERGNI